MKTIALKLIRLYQLMVSPWLGNHCRFWPTCSEYAYGSLQNKGFIIGSLKSLGRLSRCHPLSKGGLDPVE